MIQFLRDFRHCFRYATFFSMLVNILQLTFSIYMLQVFDLVLTSYNLSTLQVITLAALICLGALALLDWIRGRLMAVVGIEFEKRMAVSVLSQSLSNANAPVTVQGKAALRDVQTLRNFMGSPQVFILLDFPWIPVYLIIMFLMHSLLGVVGVCGGLISLGVGYLTDRASRAPLQEANARNAMSGRFLDMALRNAPVVHSMGMNEGIAQRWEAENQKVIQLQTRASLKVGLLQAIAKSYRQGLQVVIYGIGAYLAVTYQATAGIMVAASIIIGKALAPVDQAMGAYRVLFDVRGAYGRLKEMLDQPQPPPPMELPDPAGEISTENMALTIGSRPIIAPLSFRMPAGGQSLALIGPSAAGKSSLCKLFLGIWQPTSGHVRIDGADLMSWDPVRLGQFFGYLPQDVELFPGTIAENIARMEEEPDIAKVITAATMAGVHDLILHLPGGYDTPIYGPGYVLSGGQRQQVGLARALYGNPKVVVLDEPNANLDHEGEKALLQAVINMKKNQTTLVLVTHKMNILSVVDSIMVIRNGQVLMCGPRDEVLNQMRAAQQQQQQQQQQPGALPRQAPRPA
ncbi:type I secretion system permease/ATPase [Desulfosarcina sp. OttesenSCG-928-B08]|nr:type I secretion system permease/ATPase [Desulfosarcina sp. OttesenSCG-928-B08]